MNQIATTRSLIDENLSLQWCRDNIVVPLSVEPALPPKVERVVKVAVGNFTYLGSIGDFLKTKFGQNGYLCTFVEKSKLSTPSLLKILSCDAAFSNN